MDEPAEKKQHCDQSRCSRGQSPRSSKETRLVIIGAGFAGLCAARTIQGAGDRVEVIILEASHAVGGRARTGTVSKTCKLERCQSASDLPCVVVPHHHAPMPPLPLSNVQSCHSKSELHDPF